MDLSFDDPKRAIHLTGGGFGIFGLKYDPSVRYRSAVAAKKGLGLIFVDIHEMLSRLAAI